MKKGEVNPGLKSKTIKSKYEMVKKNYPGNLRSLYDLGKLNDLLVKRWNNEKKLGVIISKVYFCSILREEDYLCFQL